MCGKCKKICAGLLLLVGVLLLLRDVGAGEYFLNIQWWTALILLAGIGGVASSMCPDCKACGSCCGHEKKK